MNSKKNPQDLPQHIAIIMDGNRRWAQKRGLDASAGHRAGAKNLEEIVNHCHSIGIKYLTVYALSTENLHHRSANEIKGLFKLIVEVFNKKKKEYQKSGIKLFILGNFQAFPLKIKNIIKKILKLAILDKKLTFNVALNYGSRNEIVNAIKQIIKDKVPASKINEKLISKYLYTKDQPDPDLIIRPGGEKRMSNFLLWQMSYAELYFSDVLWPDFNVKKLDEAIKWYQDKKRNFGK
jgi:undecaprenyl diphosphate synthase